MAFPTAQSPSSYATTGHMANHFDTIADIYNRVWYFSEDYQNQMLGHIIDLLRLSPQDALADVGGGTGVYTRLLHDRVGLRKAYCVEPARNMWREAAKLAGIEAFCADAEGFMGLGLDFTKVLLKEAVHHIPARASLWRHLREKLPADGRLLIVTRPQDTALPLFEQAKAVFRAKQPRHEALIEELEEAGFATELRTRPYVFQLDKETWFGMIRSRFMSDLAGFTDAEIEAGIAEIGQRHQGDTLSIPDTILYIAAWPKA